MENKNALVIRITLLLAAVLAFAALGALSVCASMALSALIALALMTACFASVRLSHDSPFFFLIGLPVFEIVWLISKDLTLGLFSLLFLPAGFLLARSLRKEGGRTASILRLSALFGAVSLVFFLILYRKTGNAFSALPEVIKAFFDTLRDDLTAAVGETIDSYLSLFVEQLPGYGLEMLTASYLIETAVTLVKSVFPALFICLVNLFGFAAFYAGLLVTRICGYYPLLPVKKSPFLPSPISAVLFIASYVIQTFSSLANRSGSTFLAYLYIVTLNLTLILFPFFFIMGIKGIVARFSNPLTKKSATVMLIIALVAFFLNPSIALYVLSFLGAFDTLTIHRVAKAKNDSEQNNAQ